MAAEISPNVPASAEFPEKIPIIVGVTGHRNLVEEDKPKIKEQVRAGLSEIVALYKGKDGAEDTPVVLLDAFAQGADMLCAEVAYELGIDVYAVLPRKAERYLESFDDEEAKAQLFGMLGRAKRVFVAPDAERSRDWLETHGGIDKDSYEYRQVGIYIAEHSHVLLALWDGKPPKSPYGCGTVEVIKFALEHKYLSREHMFSPGSINDSAVLWVKSRRQGDGSEADIRRQWLTSNLVERRTDPAEAGKEYKTYDAPPEFLKSIIAETVGYNNEPFTFPEGATVLWKAADGSADAREQLDPYRRVLRYHYAKADDISYSRNQTMYNRFLLWLAVLAVFVALTFLLYDDASIPYMIIPCTVLIGIILVLCKIGKKKAYQQKYIKYRAFAEALRIQFYLSMCLKEKIIETYVSELYSWAQRVESVWIDKALRAMAVIGDTDEKLCDIDTTKVIDVWIGMNKSPKGQLCYHSSKREGNRKLSAKYDRMAEATLGCTLVSYVLIFVLELVGYCLKAFDIAWFWEYGTVGPLSCRDIAIIVLGVLTAASLLFSSYWGKLSFDRKASDNEKMCSFYAAALERWDEVKVHEQAAKKFLTEIAREEIVENGIWCSYVNENRLEINI